MEARAKRSGQGAEKRDTGKAKKRAPKTEKKSAAKTKLPKVLQKPKPEPKPKAAAKSAKPEQKAGKADRKAAGEKRERVFRFVRNAKQNAFLNALAKTGTVKGATALSGISRASHYRWLEDDGYRVGMERARRMAADLLEDEAWRRGVEGDERPIYNKHGEKISSVRYYSDRLLEKLLAANLPEKYKERVEQTVVGDGAVEFCWEGEETDGDEGRGEEDHNSLSAGKALAGEDSPRA